MQIATDPLSLLFIVCLLIGLLFMIVSAFMGDLGQGHSGHVAYTGHGVHTVGHVNSGHGAATKGLQIVQGHGTHGTRGPAGEVAKTHSIADQNFSLLAYFNPISIAVFLVGFGLFGYIFHNAADFSLPLALILASVSGLLIAALMLVLINRFFSDSEGATVQDVSDRIGMLGKVSVTIQENSIGQVLYVSPGGMRKSIPARSVDGRRLERDQEVVVVNYQQGVAEVDTWDHFINREEGNADIVPDDDELAKLRALLEKPELEKPEQKDTEFVMRKDVQKEK